MCGRYKLTVPYSEIVRLYNLTSTGLNLEQRYNIAPTQDEPVIRADPETKQRRLKMLRWGLVPFWAKDLKIGSRSINARAETVATKPAFREAFRHRRCLIPADGFYEGKKLDGKTKQPYAIVPAREGDLFSFAGLWERWKDKATSEVVRSCTIVATGANALCAPIHDRTPVILPPDAWGPWLGETPATPEELMALLKPCAPEIMRAFPISTRVNNVRNEGPELLEAVPVGEGDRAAGIQPRSVMQATLRSAI